MGNNFSWFSFWTKSSEHDLQMVLYRRYITRSELFDTIKLNENRLLAIGNELGTIQIYNLAAEDDGPQQTRYLEYTSGGVSDMVWINDNILAVGTTRGNVVVFSLCNEHNRLIEVCSVKAHGDGAARIPVESMDYSKTSQRLVTVGEGVGSMRVWNVLPTGILTPVQLSAVSTAYMIPNFVSFTNKGSKVIVGFPQTARVDRFSLEPFRILDSSILDEETDQRLHQRMSSALWLESVNQLVVLNPTRGLRLYDGSSFQRKDAKSFAIDDECHQQLAGIKGGSYFAIAGTNGRVQIYHSQDATMDLKLKVAGRNTFIQAIHASPTTDGYELLAAASYTDEQPTALTIWCNQVKHTINPKQGASDFSTFRVVILCALVSILCHLVVSTMSLDRQMMASFVPISEGSSTSSSPTISQPAVPTTMGNLPSQPAIVASPMPSIIFL